MEIRKVTVVGAGDMGHGIAQLFASTGFDVVLHDKYPRMIESAKERISASLGRWVERGKTTKEQASAALSRISYSEDLRQAVAGSDLVVEAVPESLELKRAVFKEAGGIVRPEAILASNTSNIRISEIAQGVAGPERVVGMHFFNPPTAMKLVEVIPGEETAPEVVDAVFDVSVRLGKSPVRVLKDSPGFIVNRINAADTLFFCLVQDRGLASPQEVDAYVRAQGLPMGVYELLDFSGIDVAQDMLAYFAGTISPEYAKGTTFGSMVKENRLGKKTALGFYSWKDGKAEIARVEPTEKVSVMDIFSVEINEAVKLIEEGVAHPDDVEKGVTLGMNRPFGPIAVAKDMSNAELKAKLEELAKRFDCAVFAPAKSIVDGKLRDAIEGRLKNEPARPERRGTEGGAETPSGTVPVRFEKLGGNVARIVLNRPKLNTINAGVLDGLDHILAELEHDKETRVVLVTGEGSVFSAGADLSQYFNSSAAFMDFSRRGAAIMKRLSEVPQITIAVLKGYALGGGLELALSCDLRLATGDVELGFPELTRGLVPAWSGSQRLTRLVGLSTASDLILTSSRIRGSRAHEIGLANRLISSGDPDEVALETAKALASSQAPVAVALAKRLLHRGAEVPEEIGLEMEALAAGVLFGTEDLREGISAFLGKRKPEFKGK